MGLVTCATCGQAAKKFEERCPHCGAPLRDAAGKLGRTAAAVLLGLTAATGVATLAACYGIACEDDDRDCWVNPDGTAGAGGTSATGTGGSLTLGSGSGGMGANSSPCGTDCTRINTPICQRAQCNVQTGQCEVVHDEDGVACEDGLFCTIADSCSAGICVGGQQNDCGMNPMQCMDLTCEESARMCSYQPITICTNSDNCCPMGCTMNDDNDC